MRARYLSSLFENIPLRCRVVIRSELEGTASLAHPYVSPLTHFIFQLEKQHGPDYITTQEDLAALTLLVIKYGSLHCNTHYCLTTNSENVAHRALIALAKALTRTPNPTRTQEVQRHEICHQTLTNWRRDRGLGPITNLSYLSLLNPQLQNEKTLNCEPIQTIPLNEIVLSDNGFYAWHIDDLQAAIISTCRLTNPYAANSFFSDAELRRIFTKSADLAANYKMVIENQILPAYTDIKDATIQLLLTLTEATIIAAKDPEQTPESRAQQFNVNMLTVMNRLTSTEKNALDNLRISVADHNKTLLEYRSDPRSCFSEMVNNLYLTLKNVVRATKAISILQNIDELNDGVENGYYPAKLQAH